MMTLKFSPTDSNFKQNLWEMRRAVIQQKLAAPERLVVIIDGKAVDATTAHIRLDEWFAYSAEHGEHRVEMHRVGAVTAFFE